MQRSRGTEMPQRQTSRVRQPLRTSSSNSDPSHLRSATGRSAKVVGDRRSSRGPQGSSGSADSVNQKKLGTRISDLESQLGQAQEELKILKNQLASAESAKQEAQKQLEIKKTKKPTSEDSEAGNDNVAAGEVCDQPETDVFEVEKRTVETESSLVDSVEKETELAAGNVLNGQTPVSEMKKPSVDELALKDNEINTLKTKLEEKEKELEVAVKNSEILNNQLTEANSSLSSSKAKEEEMSLRLSRLLEELEASRNNVVQLNEKIKYVEGEKEALEAEMRMMRVQTEQWRKAADAAAAVLASDQVTGNGKIPIRCGSMDKYLLETPYTGYNVGSPGDYDYDLDGFGKRRGSGIKMFGELWKKKGQK